MSIQTRREILFYTKKSYVVASSKDKSKILDEFVSVTGYLRKYAIHLLGRKDQNNGDKSKITDHLHELHL